MTGSRRAEVLGVAWIALLTTLAMGVSNGDGNHPQWLLYGFRLADPTFLPGDWFTWETRHYHAPYGWLVAALLRAGWLEGGLAAANVAAALGFVVASYAAVRAVYPRPLVPWAIAVMLAVAGFTNSLGFGDLLGPRFETRVFASVATMTGIALLAWRRWTAAGIVLGLAALAHAQFAVLLSATLGGLALVSAGRLPVAALVRLGVPFALLAAPNLLRAARYAGAPDVDAAYALYMPVCYPAHYLPATWPARAWGEFGAALLLGAGGLVLRRPRANRPLAALLAAVAVMVALALALGYPATLEPVNRVWPWRFAVYLAFAGYVAAGAALAAPPARGRGARLVGAALLVAGLAVFTRFAPPHGRWLAGPAAAAAPLAVAAARTLRRERPAWGAAAAALPLAVVSAGMLPAVAEGIRRSHLDIRPAVATRAPLYAWVRASTDPASVFAVPPHWGGDFRLVARRPIVADWRVTPLWAPDILEWYRRIDALAGGTGPRTLAEVRGAWERLGCPQLLDLRARYGVRYVVRERRSAGAPCGVEVYRDARHLVLDLDA